jgi:hypothetical protein
MSLRFPFPLAISCLALLAQDLPAQLSQPTGPWKAERSKRGDTTVVRTVSGSVWGDKVRLVEDLRIGTKEGDGPDSFGFIHSLAILPDEVVAVFDGSVPALRLFGPDGKHLRTLGRKGAGPGEYGDQSLGLAVDRDGVLVMYDPRNLRLNRWRADGTLLPSFRTTGSLFTGGALQLDNAGNTYIKVILEEPRPGEAWKMGLARIDRNGNIVDTLQPPPIAGDAPASGTFFEPRKDWLLDRQGRMVSGFSAAYAISVSMPGGPVVRIERNASQVPLAPEERKNFQEAADARRSNPMLRDNSPSRSVPGKKPFWRALYVDLDGRIWVELYNQGEPFEPTPPPARPGAPSVPPIRWRERRAYDVFQTDGTYLGRVTLPVRTSFAQAKGSRVWTLLRGDDDEQYVVRYRIDGAR